MYIDETGLLYMEESKYKKSILDGLKKDFWIFEEVSGVDNFGNKVIIDAIIEPKEPELWAVKNICIGIEFKRRDPFTKPKEYGYMLQQAVWYMGCKFIGRPGGRRLSFVLLCPLNIGFYRFSEEQYEMYCKEIDKLGVGTIRWWKKDGDMHIICNGDKVQWSRNLGVMEGRINKYQRWRTSSKEKIWHETPAQAATQQ
jgi:hypothetical protein